MISPAVTAFAALVQPELVLAEVWVHDTGGKYELRHVRDRVSDASALRDVSVEELRAVAQNTATGEFRPIKAAPTLVSGWRAVARNAADLGRALDHLYPGALADWLAVQAGPPPVTHYREYTGRQTGMYRLTQLLSDEQAGRMIAACCGARFCLKRRWWTVPGLAPDTPEGKSLIPCLEPCAVLLEFARKAMRMEQGESAAMREDDLETIEEALVLALERPAESGREGDFGAALNPRRIEWLLSKVRQLRTECAAARAVKKKSEH